MDLTAYLAETAFIARTQAQLLDDVATRLSTGGDISPLEENGVLHALQILIENSIGKAKQTLKAKNEPVPISAYDAFAHLAWQGVIESSMLAMWQSAIGLRNRIVHDYMNVDMRTVLQLVRTRQYQPIVTFLLMPITPCLQTN